MIEIKRDPTNCDNCVNKIHEPYKLASLQTLDPSDRYFLMCRVMQQPIDQIDFCSTGPIVPKPPTRMAA